MGEGLALGPVGKYTEGIDAPGKVLLPHGVAAWLTDAVGGVKLVIGNDLGALVRVDLDQLRWDTLCYWGLGKAPVYDGEAGRLHEEFRDLVWGLVTALGGAAPDELAGWSLGSLALARTAPEDVDAARRLLGRPSLRVVPKGG